MTTLYQVLEISKKASNAEIEKAYRLNAYKCRIEKNQEKFIELNAAREILLDPYKRSFYDRFGKFSKDLLLRPVEGHIYSRYFTSLNVILMTISAFCVLFNLSSLYFFFVLFNKNIERFSLIIISPIFFLMTILNSWNTVMGFKQQLSPFHNSSLHYIVICLEITLIALYCDGIFAFSLSFMSILLLEFILLLYYYMNNKDYFQISKDRFMAIAYRPLIFIQFYLNIFQLRMFTPLLIILTYLFKFIREYLIIAAAVLVYTTIIFFFGKSFNWFAASFALIYMIGASYLFYLLIRFLSSNKPITTSAGFTMFLRLT